MVHSSKRRTGGLASIDSSQTAKLLGRPEAVRIGSLKTNAAKHCARFAQAGSNYCAKAHRCHTAKFAYGDRPGPERPPNLLQRFNWKKQTVVVAARPEISEASRSRACCADGNRVCDRGQPPGSSSGNPMG